MSTNIKLPPKKQTNYFFLKCGWRKKSSPGRTQNNFFLINSNEFFKVYTKRTNLTALSSVEKQRVLNFKAGVHFKNFYMDRKKFLRHKNTFKGSEKILEEQEKLNFVRKDMVNYEAMPKISARKRILCELLRLNFKLKNNIKKKRL